MTHIQCIDINILVCIYVKTIIYIWFIFQISIGINSIIYKSLRLQLLLILLCHNERFECNILRGRMNSFYHQAIDKWIVISFWMKIHSKIKCAYYWKHVNQLTKYIFLLKTTKVKISIEIYINALNFCGVTGVTVHERKNEKTYIVIRVTLNLCKLPSWG